MAAEKYQIETSDYQCDACQRAIDCGSDYYSGIVLSGEAFARRDYCTECWRGTASRAVEGPGGGPEPDGGFYACWRTRRAVQADAPPQRLRFDSEVVLDFFRHLSGEGESPEDTAEGAREDAREGVREANSPDPAPEAPEAAGTAGAEGEPPGGSGTPPEGPETGPAPARRSPSEGRDLRFVLALLLIRKKVLNFESSGVDNGREWLKLTEKSEPERVYWVENPDLSDQELERVRDDLGELLQMKI